MYELVSEGDSNVLTFKAIGMLSDGDYDTLNDDMEKLLAKHDYVRVLVDWERLDGWEPGARTVSSWFGRVHRNLFERMAIVADSKWKDETMRIRDVLKPAEVKVFAPGKRDDAWAWLTEG